MDADALDRAARDAGAAPAGGPAARLAPGGLGGTAPAREQAAHPTGPDRATAPYPLEHMKWWGWGRPEVAFTVHDKPAFTPFLRRAIGVEASAAPVPVRDFASLPVPSTRAGEALLADLRAALGEAHVRVDAHERVVHTYGKSARDLLRLRAGDLPRPVDVVVYPGDEDQVAAVVALAVAADAVVIPFGGGSNIAGSLEPTPGEPRAVVSVDLGRLDRVLEVDDASGLARVQAGVLGPALEDQLAARGWTLGHFPDSFTHSSLGGWVATRSSGMQSDKYGDIADIVKGLRVVGPSGVLALRALPSTSTGPSLREMVLGSEGRLGVITEATVQVHRVPEERRILAYLFPSFEAGLAAMHAISASDAAPSVTRVSDARETEMSFATRKASSLLSSLPTRGLMALLARRGWDLDELCLSFIGYEGGPAHVKHTRRIVGRIVKAHGGIAIGAGPGALYDQKKFDTPYIRDFLLDRGAVADVSETAAPWSALGRVYTKTIAAARAAFEQLGVQGYVMCHLSHSYRSGACLYFTFAFPHGEDPIGEYDLVKRAIQQSFVDEGATLSHHHGVGVEHEPWMSAVVSEPGVDLLRGLFAAADPGSHLNPGKVVTGG